MDFDVKSEINTFKYEESPIDYFLDSTNELIGTSVKEEEFAGISGIVDDELATSDSIYFFHESNADVSEDPLGNPNNKHILKDISGVIGSLQDRLIGGGEGFFQENEICPQIVQSEEDFGDDHNYCLPSSSYTRKILKLKTNSKNVDLGMTVHQNKVGGNILPLKVKDVAVNGLAHTAGLKIGDLVYLSIKSNTDEEVEMEVITPGQSNSDDFSLDHDINESKGTPLLIETNTRNESVPEEISCTDLTIQQDMLDWNCSSLPNLSFDLSKKNLQRWNPENDVMNQCILVYYAGYQYSKLLFQPYVNVNDQHGEIQRILDETRLRSKANRATTRKRNERVYAKKTKTPTRDDDVTYVQIGDSEDSEYIPSDKRKEMFFNLSKKTKATFVKMSNEEKLNYLVEVQSHLQYYRDISKQLSQKIKFLNSKNKTSPAPSETKSKSLKQSNIFENPGPDYTLIMSKETLEKVKKQTNEENINLIGKMEFELRVTEQRNNNLKSTISNLETQINTLKTENETLKENRSNYRSETLPDKKIKYVLLKGNQNLQKQPAELNRLLLKKAMKPTSQKALVSKHKTHISKSTSTSGMQPDNQIICSYTRVIQGTAGGDQNVAVTTIDQEGVEKCETFKKPDISLSNLVFLAIINSKHHESTLQEIFEFISDHFPYYQYTKDPWKKSIKAYLPQSKIFVQLRGRIWALHPSVPLQVRVDYDQKSKEAMKCPDKLKEFFSGTIILDEKGPKQPFKRIRLEKVDENLESNMKANTIPVSTIDKTNYIIKQANFRNHLYQKDPLSNSRINDEAMKSFGEEVSHESLKDTEDLSQTNDEIEVKVESIFSNSEIYHQEDLLEEMEDIHDAEMADDC